MSDGDDYLNSQSKNKFIRFCFFLYRVLDVPVTAVREKFILPIQSRSKLQYYHRHYHRVPTIDECEIDDNLCYYEANEQYRRDRKVEDNILKILRQRRQDCYFFHHYQAERDKYCQKETNDYYTAEANWFAKYGDMGHKADAVSAYMKQKHRLIWERRHGPVGSGRKTVLQPPEN